VQVIDCEQGTPEWFENRAGLPTASCFDKIITTKGEKSKQYKKYLLQLAGEAIIKGKEDSYQSSAMTRGIELEPQARAMYEMVNDVDVKEVGLCIMDDSSCGCSPDGLAGDDGGVEIKCPTLAVHCEYLLGGKLPTKYFQQVQGSLYVTGRDWWDFMSFYPGMKPLIVRVTPDREWHDKFRVIIAEFNRELAETIKKLK